MKKLMMMFIVLFVALATIQPAIAADITKDQQGSVSSIDPAGIDDAVKAQVKMAKTAFEIGAVAIPLAAAYGAYLATDDQEFALKVGIAGVIVDALAWSLMDIGAWMERNK